MLNIISLAGIANATINSTDDLSILLFGLIGLVWLSAGMIVLSALQESFSRPTKSGTLTKDEASAYRLAA